MGLMGRSLHGSNGPKPIWAMGRHLYGPWAEIGTNGMGQNMYGPNGPKISWTQNWLKSIWIVTIWAGLINVVGLYWAEIHMGPKWAGPVNFNSRLFGRHFRDSVGGRVD